MQITVWANEEAKDAYNEDYPYEGHPLIMYNYSITYATPSDSYTRPVFSPSSVTITNGGSPTLYMTFTYSPTGLMNYTSYSFSFEFLH
jgi:hypothetical protein